MYNNIDFCLLKIFYYYTIIILHYYFILLFYTIIILLLKIVRFTVLKKIFLSIKIRFNRIRSFLLINLFTYWSITQYIYFIIVLHLH